MGRPKKEREALPRIWRLSDEQMIEQLGDPDGVLVVDETGFLNKGI